MYWAFNWGKKIKKKGKFKLIRRTTIITANTKKIAFRAFRKIHSKQAKVYRVRRVVPKRKWIKLTEYSYKLADMETS